MTIKEKLFYSLLVMIVWPLSWIAANRIGILNPINWDLNIGLIFGYLICLFTGPKKREKLDN
jgi:hypothetical protein